MVCVCRGAGIIHCSEVEGCPAQSGCSANVFWTLYIFLMFLIKRAGQDEGSKFVCGFVVLLIWCLFSSFLGAVQFFYFSSCNACLMLPGGIAWSGHWRGYFRTEVPRKMHYHLMFLLSFIQLCPDFWWFLQKMWDQGWSESYGIAQLAILRGLQREEVVRFCQNSMEFTKWHSLRNTNIPRDT